MSFLVVGGQEHDRQPMATLDYEDDPRIAQLLSRRTQASLDAVAAGRRVEAGVARLRPRELRVRVQDALSAVQEDWGALPRLLSEVRSSTVWNAFRSALSHQERLRADGEGNEALVVVRSALQDWLRHALVARNVHGAAVLLSARLAAEARAQRDRGLRAAQHAASLALVRDRGAVPDAVWRRIGRMLR